MTSKFALVIANTDHQDENLAKLTAPGMDAEDFARVLREPHFAGFDDVKILLNEKDENTRRAIARFLNGHRFDDLLLLYFSGHGIRNDQGRLFLAANDTDISILDATGVPAEFVTSAMNNSRSQRQLLILDCCNSGAFAYGTKSTAALGKSMGTAEAFEGNGFGRIVLTATDATQFAWEGDKVIGDTNTQNSVFTHYLIEGLKGEADHDSDGRITVDELYNYAYEQVVRHTPKQTPSKWSYRQQGDIYLCENLKRSEVKPAVLPVDTVGLLTSPSTRSRNLGIQDLVKFLTGNHLGLTRAAEDKLREIAANDDSPSLRETASDILIRYGFSAGPVVAFSIEDEKIKRQAEEKIALQKAEWEAQVKVKRDADQAVAREKVRREHLQQEVAKKTVLEKIQRESVQKAGGNKPASYSLPFALGGLGLLFLIGAFIVVGFLIIKWLPSLSVTPVPTEAPTATVAPIQEATDVPAVPDPPVVTPHDIGSTMTGTDGMTLFYVPAGEFTMGSNQGEPDEKPVHTVNLDAFWIDQTEVTNEMYSLCVAADVCKQPAHKGSSTHARYYDSLEFDNYPVIYVDWDMAKTYCEWAGRDLPTEAQWEKAARGTESNIYPWGNTFDGKRLNFCDTNCSSDWAYKLFNDDYADVSPVGNYPTGKSVYGALDMAGNVWEWVNDWYDVYPGGDANASNTFGQKYRVLRGGSWLLNMKDVRSTNRYWVDLSDSYNYFSGFRCADSP